MLFFLPSSPSSSSRRGAFPKSRRQSMHSPPPGWLRKTVAIRRSADPQNVPPNDSLPTNCATERLSAPHSLVSGGICFSAGGNMFPGFSFQSRVQLLLRPPIASASEMQTNNFLRVGSVLSVVVISVLEAGRGMPSYPVPTEGGRTETTTRNCCMVNSPNRNSQIVSQYHILSATTA